MEVAEVLLRAGGVASTAALVEVVGRPDLRRAVESGAVVRAGRGTYRLPESEEHQVDAARLHACLSLTSAALAHGWPVKLPPPRPQVVVPRGRKVEAARRSKVQLRWGEVTPRELAAGVTDPVRTVLDCARFLATDEALAVADSALRAGVPRTDLLLACARLPRHGRGRAFRIVELATSLAANPFESVLRAVLLDLPGACFEPQVWIGNIGRTDLADRRRRIVIEADSFEFHADPAAFAADMTRYNAFVCEGWLVLRFAWKHVMFEQDYVRATVSALMSPERLSVHGCRGCPAPEDAPRPPN